jgi:type I restriction enzyme S subunit
MQPYPVYKNSGVTWLGEIPDHWEVYRLGSQFYERREKVSDKDFPALSVTKKGILPQLASAAKSNDGDNRKKVCNGDFVINSRSDRKGSSGVSPYTGSVSLINTVLKPISLNERYVHNFFRSHVFQEEFYRVGRGIVADLWSTKYSDMRTIMIPQPSTEEQIQIARYLDWQTAKINTFIKAKKKLIALLKEQKQNIINEAVTKGINPNVKMKDSGVEWLGEIPEHWETAPLKRFCIIQNGITLGGSYLGKDIVSKPYLRVANVQNGYFSLGNVKNIEIPQKDVKRYELNYGDVLVTEGGDLDKLGRGFVWESQIESCLHQNHIFAIRVQKDKLLPTFLSCVLNAKPGREYFTLKSKKTTNLASTNSSTVKAFILPHLGVKEQQEIVAFIEKETGLIERTIARTEREIELIQEYRTRLVSDVVTGKVDVRNVVIPDFEPVDVEPDAADEDETGDEPITEESDA